MTLPLEVDGTREMVKIEVGILSAVMGFTNAAYPSLRRSRIVSGSIGFDPSDFTDGTSANLLHEFIAPGWRRSMFRRHGPALSLSRHGPNKKSVKKCAAGADGRNLTGPCAVMRIYHTSQTCIGILWH